MPLVNVIPKTFFSIDGRANSTQEFTIRNAVSMVDFVSGVLIVRLHGKVTWSGTASAAVVLQPIQIVPEEPQTFFLPLTSPDFAVATLLNGDAPPALYTTSFTNPPSHLKVLLRWIQGATATGTQGLSIGIDIDGRVA